MVEMEESARAVAPQHVGGRALRLYSAKTHAAVMMKAAETGAGNDAMSGA